MMRKIARNRMERWFGCLSAALLLAGCSAEKPAATAAPAKAAAVPAATPGVSAMAKPSAHRSKFTEDPNLRDPFFPNSKRRETAAAAATPGTTKVALDVPALLQEGFTGSVIAGGTRIAVINNILLEPGRTVTIPLGAGAQRRDVTVRVRDVLPNAVILEIQGQRQPITIRGTQK